MARNQRHVTPAPKGWKVVRPGSPKPTSTHRTQAAADRQAKRDLAKHGGGEAIIHRRDGKIRDADTVAPGNDPNPPRDTK